MADYRQESLLGIRMPDAPVSLISWLTIGRNRYLTIPRDLVEIIEAYVCIIDVSVYIRASVYLIISKHMAGSIVPHSIHTSHSELHGVWCVAGLRRTKTTHLIHIRNFTGAA